MEEIIKACDTALNDCIKAKNAANKVIEQQQTVIVKQNTELTRLREPPGFFERQEVWFVIGVALGIGLTKALTK